MIKNKTLKIISGSFFLTIFIIAGFFIFSSINQTEAKTYKVKVGSKTVYVRTAHGSKYAKQKAQRAFRDGKLLSSCRNVSYKCHWCRSTPPPRRTNDICPNIPGAQSAIPTGYELVDGNCLQDMCLNINGFQATVPTGYQDVGGRICQMTSDFNVSCQIQDPIIQPGNEAAFLATPFNSSGNVKFELFENGVLQNTQNSSGAVIFRKVYSTEGNKRVTIVATDSTGATAQRTCGVMVAQDEDNLDEDLVNDGLLDLDGDGIPDIDLTARSAQDITATVDFRLDRPLTNTTCVVTWSSENALECYLVSKSGTSEKVELNGTRNVAPGEYFMRCISPSLKITETDSKVCRLNPDIREI